MTENHSSLAILQDPLLMLLALMLLGSLPFILPSGPAPEGPPIDDEAIARIEQELVKLEADHLGLIARRGWLAGHVQAPSNDAQLTIQLRALRARIANLSGLLERARTEASKHKKALELQENSGTGNLQIEISATRAKIRVLKDRKIELQKFVTTRSGLPIYTSKGSKDRTPILAEATDSRIYLIDKQNHSFRVRPMSASGFKSDDMLVTVSRKSVARGEDSGALQSGQSNWHTELSSLNPEKYYVFVWVREDGFRAFLQARLIAQKLGFPVGWSPLDYRPIMFRLGSGESSDDEGPPVIPGMGKQL